MTMTYERTRSLIEAEEFLREIMKDKDIPEKTRTRARSILRHYPTEREILFAGENEFLMRYKEGFPNLSSPFLSPGKTFDEEEAFTEKMAKLKGY